MSFISVIAGSKLAIGLIALGTITVGGTAAAAYAGVLPDGLQNSAHSLIGAPAPGPTDPTATPTPEPTGTATDTPTPTPDPTSTAGPVGPDATGLAAHGLCTAYERGGLAATSVAFASLEKAAGGADAIDAYCATIVAPGHSADHRPTPTAEPTAEPTDEPETDDSGAHADHGHAQDPAGSSHSHGQHGHR
jgi:hypothetical protein